MLSFVLGKVNSSLVELLFQVPVSILPPLLHAGIHHSTRQSPQNHILLRYTLFLYRQQTLIFVSRLLPIHSILVIHSFTSQSRSSPYHGFKLNDGTSRYRH